MAAKVFVHPRSIRVGLIGVAASVAALISACAKAAPTTTPTPGGGATAVLRSSQTGVYTESQATAGKATFDLRCAGCHVTAVRMTGPDFRKAWQGQTVWKFFATVRETMPSDNPGSLTDQQYADVIAHLMQASRMPAGTTALPTDSATLSKIRMDTVAVRTLTGSR
jgi:mono/diheme cytochrome c family protein